jgi:hypothetical protein
MSVLHISPQRQQKSGNNLLFSSKRRFNISQVDAIKKAPW